MIDGKDYLVKENEKIDLSKVKTLVKPYYGSKKEYNRILKEQILEMSDLQELHYASNKYSMLIIFQAMDAAGKDSTIRHVMSGINPQGCQVFSFKQPSMEELDHDFLWRSYKCLPERGRIGIFNRSYYEEVLVVKVHPELLVKQDLPDEVLKDKNLWSNRYHSINEFEKYLHQNGTVVIKFFLNVSKEEQKNRFIDRIKHENKNWKFSMSDVEERKHWDSYMKAYEMCLSTTSKKHAPWYVIPADDKKNARLIVSQIIVDTFKTLKMAYPKPSKEHEKELLDILDYLEKEK
ncbi:MAG: polyphosphate kinase 2 family protein [Clostridia bacterium]|nr:polyphosphate kinase 2 family protein [Clostridia bacterium]